MKRLDQNGDGQLERSELPPQMAERFLARADADGDGKISEQEMRQAFQPTARPMQPGRPVPRPTAPEREAPKPTVFEVGKAAPDFELKLLTQIEDFEGKRGFEITDEKVKLSALEGEKVVCLFLSSYTWGPFRRTVPAAQRLYASYKDNEDVAFYFVYLEEIHPAEQGRTGPEIEQHETFEERVTAASDCLDGLEMTIPTLIDTMDGEAQKAFHVHAAATVIIDQDGLLAYHTTGPNGCKPDEADRVIRDILGLPERETEAKDAPE